MGWKVFQIIVWCAAMAGMVQWHWDEYARPVNPMVAFVAGGLAAYYGTGIAKLFLLPFQRLFDRYLRGRQAHLTGEQPTQELIVPEPLSGIFAGSTRKPSRPNGR